MKSRSITGLIIAVGIIGSVLLRLINPLFFDIVIVILMIFASLEVATAIKAKYAPPITVVLMFFPIVAYAAFMLCNKLLNAGGTPGIAGLSGIVIAVMVTFAFMMFAMFFTKEVYLANVISTTFVMIYPTCMMSFLLYLNNTRFGTLPIAIVFIVSCFSDMFALFFGVLIKGPKLAPNISPKKTVSGAFGGLFGGLLGSGITFAIMYLPEVFGFLQFGVISVHPTLALTRNIIHFVTFGIVGSVCTQIGDLVASLLKRNTGIKDFGTIFPGHGGFMDRLDGIIFNTVFLSIYFMALAVFEITVGG
ncbi:MAG: phosphatidate cytidylyltransferase [Clostridiales bacterium]|jgi:phosphatidate cytidylyltransferase|nr:phosphatidate cytidylyltransferase [Clostridiales bacterium]